MKNLGKQRILILLLGVTTASVIIFSQIFYFQAATYCQEKAKTEQGDQDQQTDSNASHISLPSSTISFAPHIELNQDLSFVLGALFEATTREEVATDVVLPVNRLFHTLFRFIISPNAP
jgi:hypothetical protein